MVAGSKEKKRFKWTHTILFVDYKDIPSEILKDITNGRILEDWRQQREEHNRNLIDYPRDVSTPTDDTTTAKIVWNIVVSNTKAN